MNHIVQDMYLERECKGSVRYDCVEQDGSHAVNAVYINKRKLSSPYPKKIRITITERDA